LHQFNNLARSSILSKREETSAVSPLPSQIPLRSLVRQETPLIARAAPPEFRGSNMAVLEKYLASTGEQCVEFSRWQAMLGHTDE